MTTRSVCVPLLLLAALSSAMAVEDLRAERQAGDGRIALAWTPLAGASSQQVERQTADGPWTTVSTLGGAVGSWTDNAVVAGGLHAYRLRSQVAGVWQSSPMTWATAGWTIAADREVDRFTAVREPDGQLRVYIEHRFTPISQWRVELNTSGSWEPAAVIPATSDQLFIPAPTPGVFTQIRLRAEHGAAVSAWSLGFVVDFGSNQVGQVTPTFTSHDSSQSPPAFLQLERQGPSNATATWQGEATVILRAWGDGIFHHYANTNGQDSLAIAATAWLQPQRFVALGPGGYSNVVIYEPPTIQADLAPARAVTLRPAAGTGIDLTWTYQGQGATGFLIEQYGAVAERDEQFALVAELPADARSWSDPSASIFTQYRIWAVGSGGLSQPAVSSRVSTDPVPAPSNLRVSSSSASQVTLAWDGLAAPFYGDYLIERASGSGAFHELARVAQETTSFSDTTVWPGASFRYRVRGANWDAVLPATSAPLSVTVPLPTAQPPTVTAVTAQAAAPNQITLAWKPGSGQPATTIRIRSSPDGSAWSERALLPGDQRSWSDRSSLTVGTTRHYQITAENGIAAANPVVVQATTPATAAAVNITTVTAAVGGHQRLVVRGTAADDDLEIRADGSIARIYRAGVEVASRNGPFAEIRLHGGGGDDRLRIHPSVTWRSALYADGGNNQLLADGSGPQTIVTLGFGRNTVSGTAGKVTYWLNSPDHDDASAVAAADHSQRRVHRVLRFQDNFSRELLGQNVPEPGFWANAPKSTFPTQPLWGSGPTAQDVHQGVLQTCPFTSIFQQVAHSNPELLQTVMVDLGDTTYAIAIDGGFLRFDHQLNPGSLSLLPPSGHLWAQLIEKAQYVHRENFPSWTRSNLAEAPVSAGINVWYRDDGERFAQLARRMLAARRSIGVFSLKRGEADFTTGCPGQHAHSILAVQQAADGSPRFVVRNPYGKFFEMANGFADPAHGLRLLSYADLVAFFSPPSIYALRDVLPAPPEALPQSTSVAAGASVPVILDGLDVDGFALSFAIVQAPQRGSLSGSGPDLVYTPSGSHGGSDSFSFTVSSANGVSSPATVSIAISGGSLTRSILLDVAPETVQVGRLVDGSLINIGEAPVTFTELSPTEPHQFGFIEAPLSAQ